MDTNAWTTKELAEKARAWAMEKGGSLDAAVEVLDAALETASDGDARSWGVTLPRYRAAIRRARQLIVAKIRRTYPAVGLPLPEFL